MRNLKRALSLALASVMLMGMMAVGTGAVDFADASEIANVEAASVVSALDIMVGDGTNFAPDRVVTRAEMALVLCKMMQVSDNAVDSFKDEKVFSDVETGAWYTGAIAYAANKGWIVGDGIENADGLAKFYPTNTVTTAEAAVMIQKALGYWSAKDESVVGSVLADANVLAYELGMMDDLTLSAGEGLTRDNVAGMIYNTMINTVPVTYSADLGYVFAHDTTVVADNNKLDSDTLDEYSLFAKFDLESVDGYTDALGRPVTAWELDGEIVTYTAIDADFIYIEATDADDIADDMDVDYDDNDEFFDDIAADLDVANTVVEIFGEDEDATVITYTYLAGVVTDVDEDEDDDVVTTTVTVDDDETFVTTATVDFAEDDIVVYVLANTAVQGLDPTTGEDYDSEIAIIEIAETVAGEVTATATSYIRLDGVKYEVGNTGDAVIGGEGVVVLDPNGYAISYIADDEDDSISDYAYITAIRTATEAATGSEVGYADLVLADGSEVTVALDMDDDDTAAIESDDDFVAAIYGYAVSDGLYTLEVIADAIDDDNEVMTATASEGVSITNSTRTIISGTLSAGFDTIFVDVEDGVAYTGIEEVPTYLSTESLTIYYVADDTAVAEILYITTGTLDGVDADATYIYIASDDYEASKNSDDDTIYTYVDVYVDGVQTDLESTEDDLITGTGLYAISKEDTDGYVTALSETPTVDAGIVEDVTSKAIYVGSDGYYTYDSATVFILVDVADSAVSAGSASDIIIDADVDLGDDTCTIEVLNDDTYAEIVVIYVNVKG